MHLTRDAAAPRTPRAPCVREVPTPLGRWSYAVHGERRRPADPDILMLHGLFVDSALWRAQIEPLAALGRVVALDLPGHGRSEVPPPFDLRAHADALAAALPTMDVRRAVCVGWSWGGSLALHLALRHPASVAGLALLDSSAEAQTKYRKVKYRLLVGIVRRFGLSPWLARGQIAPLMFAARTRRERPELVEEFVRGATAIPREALVRAALAVAIEQPGILDRLGAVTVPTLVLCGREDRGYPSALSEHMARAIPGARLEWIEEAGHLSALERPEEVNRFLVPFVAGLLA
jgi:3-oxoadipate enol-lactonase